MSISSKLMSSSEVTRNLKLQKDESSPRAILHTGSNGHFSISISESARRLIMYGRLVFAVGSYKKSILHLKYLKRCITST